MEGVDEVGDEMTSFLTKDPSKDQQTPTSTAKMVESIDTNSQSRTIFYVLVALLEVFGLISVILIIYWTNTFFGGYAWDGSGKEFNWHPVFMVVGLVFIYGNAAVSYRVFRRQTKLSVKLLHSILQLVAFICAVLGLTAVFDFHNANKIPNIYSLHSWLGIATSVLFACQLVFGFLGFLFPKFSEDNRRSYLAIHIFFGCAIFAMALACCVTGLTEKMLFSPYKATWSTFGKPGVVANMFTICLLLFGLVVTFILYNPAYKRNGEYLTMTE